MMNSRTEDFISFINNVSEIYEIKLRLVVVKKQIDELDKNIAFSEKAGCIASELDMLAEKRNQVNLRRIKLELRQNHLEREVLLFELEQALEE